MLNKVIHVRSAEFDDDSKYLKEIQNEMEQRRENIYFNENIDYIGE